MAKAEFENARGLWRLRWLSAIHAYADEQTQKAEWTNPEQRNPHYSYVETTCFYFDDCHLKGGYDFFQALGYVSPLEVVTVAGFHRLADEYDPSDNGWDALAVLADPKWRRVVGAARKAQDRLLPTLSNPNEIAALTRPGEWAPVSNGFRCEQLQSTVYFPRPLVPNEFEQPDIHCAPGSGTPIG